MTGKEVPVVKGLAGLAGIIAGVTMSVTSFVDMFQNGFGVCQEVVMVLGIALAAVGAVLLGAPAAIADMVGRMGRHTAVANNDQIVSAIAFGVKNAITEAVSEVMFAMNHGTPVTCEEPIFHIVVKTQEDEVLARAVQRGQHKLGRRLHPTAVW